MKEKEIYEQTIKHWGKELQIGMLTEEIGELLVEINRFRRGRTTDNWRITEEIADVGIMLKQIAILFDVNKAELDLWESKKLMKLERMLKNKSR